MQRISLYADGQRLTIQTTEPLIVAKSVNEYIASFTFSGLWEDVDEKTAVFRRFSDGKSFTVGLDENGDCVIPWEVIEAPRFYVSAYGGNLRTMTEVSLSVEKSGYDENAGQSGTVPQPNPTPTDLQLTDNLLQLTANGSAVGDGVELPEVTVDSELSDTSENPVQNKAVKAELDGKLDNSAGSVKSVNLADGCVSWNHIGDGQVTTPAIAESSIYTRHITNKNITEEKLSDEVVKKLNATVDTELSDTSENPVTASAIKSYVDGKKISQIVDCPAFANQPTIAEAELNSEFVQWNVNYYYVHIVDSEAGTFQLMTAYNDASTCIDQTFTLSGLDTGNSDTLTENALVDFLTVGDGWQMRSAGVHRVDFSQINSNCINLTFNGFSDRSGYMHFLSISGVNNQDYSCATDAVSAISAGSSGFLFGTQKYRKNILVSCNLNVEINSKYIDFSGNYLYKKTAENNRADDAGSDFGSQSPKGVFYKKDMGALPINVIKNFILMADGWFLNGTEIVAVGKERF